MLYDRKIHMIWLKSCLRTFRGATYASNMIDSRYNTVGKFQSRAINGDSHFCKILIDRITVNELIIRKSITWKATEPRKKIEVPSPFQIS